MGQGRRQFTDEFKREAVALLVSSGRPLLQIASERGISPSMLRNWRNGSGGRDAGSARAATPTTWPRPIAWRIAERILGPIGMTRSTFTLEEVLEHGNVASPHAADFAGTTRPVPLALDARFVANGGGSSGAL